MGNKRQLSNMHSNPLDAVIGLDAQGKIVKFNEQAEHILGYKAEEILGKHVEILYGEYEEAQRVKFELLRSPHYELCDFETTLIDAKNEITPIFLSAVAKLDSKGQYAGSIGYFRGRRDLIQEARQVISSLYEAKGDDFQERIVITLTAKVCAEMCLLLRYNHHTNTLKVEALYSAFQEALPHEEYSVDGILGQVLDENEVHRFVLKEEQEAPAELVSLGLYSQFGRIHNYLAIPMAYKERGREQTFGVLLLLNKHWKDQMALDEAGFSRNDTIWLSMVANEIATLVQHDYYLKSLSVILNIGTKLLGDRNILQRITTTLVEVLGFRTAYIRLLKPDRSLPIWVAAGSQTHLLITDMSDVNTSARSFYTTPAGKGIVGKAIKSNEMQVIEDVFEDSEYYFPANALEARWRGMLAAPISLHNQVVGVLVCYTGRPHVFSENEKRLVTNLAKLAALALNNSLLFEEREQEQQLLHNIIRLATEGQDTLATWRTILYEVMRLTGAERGSIHVIDYNSATLQPLIERGFPKGYSSTIHYIYPQHPTSIIGWVAKHKQPILIKNIKEESKWFEIYFEGAEDTVAELVAPLYAGDPERPVAIINLESPRLGAFTIEHHRLLESLAIFPNIITNSEKLNEVIRKKRRQHEAVKNAIRLITRMQLASLGRTEILQAIVEQAVKVTDASIGAIHIRNNDTLVLDAVYPPERRTILEKKVGRLPLWGKGDRRGIIVRTVEYQRAQLVYDVQKDIDYIPMDDGISPGSELAVFLGDGERILGTLNVEHSEVGKFDESDKDTLIALANLVVVAMEFVEQALVLAQEQRRINRMYLLAGAKLSDARIHAIAQYTKNIRLRLQNLESELQRGRMGYLDRETTRALAETRKLSEEVRRLWELEEFTQVDVIQLLDDKIFEWRSHGHRIQFQLFKEQCDSALVEVRPTELRMVLDTLVQNAVKALEKMASNHEAKVDIYLRNTKDTLDIIVEDTGPGIDDGILPLLGQAPINSSNGSGMGAYIVAGIVEDEMKGTVRWENAELCGARVIISLPLASS